MTVQEIKEKIERIKANNAIPAHLKPKMIEKQEALLKEAEGGTPAAATTKPKPSKKAPDKKEKAKRIDKSHKKAKVAGTDKTVHEIDCDELLKEHNKRIAARKKSGKKQKTKSTIEKVTHNVLTGVKQAINSIPVQKIKDHPAAEISKIKKLEKITADYLHQFKSIMGDEYSAAEVAEELKEIREIAKKLEEKYGEK